MTRLVMGGPHPELPLSADDFRSIVDAKRGLLASLYMEEKFGIVLGNYTDFELQLLDQSLRCSVYRDFSHSAFQDRLFTAIRHLSNLLSSCRAYIDQAQCDLKEVYRDRSDVVTAIKTVFTKEYDARLGYRMMEAIRNYSQHRSFPLHGVGPSYTRVDSATPQVRVTSPAQIRVEHFDRDPKFKRSVLTELKAAGESVLDLRPLLRDYIQGLASAHGQIGSLMEPDLQRWESTLAAHMSRWKDEAEGLVGLAAVHRNDHGEDQEAEELFPELIDRRRELVHRHAHAAAVGTVFVSNEELRSRNLTRAASPRSR